MSLSYNLFIPATSFRISTQYGILYSHSNNHHLIHWNGRHAQFVRMNKSGKGILGHQAATIFMADQLEGVPGTKTADTKED